MTTAHARLWPPLFLCSLLLTACSSVVPAPQAATGRAEASVSGLEWVDASSLLVAQSIDGQCIVRTVGSLERTMHDLPCEEGLEIRDSLLLLRGADGLHRIAEEPGRELLAYRDRAHWVEIREGLLVWRAGDAVRELSVERDLRDGALPPSGEYLIAVERAGEGERLIRIDTNGEELVLTEWYSSIDSWDLSDDGVELVFSARGDDSFDTWVASASRPQANPVPAVPGDETDIRWAPSGYKFGFRVATPLGGMVRSVHVPTAAVQNAAVPDYSVQKWSWHPDGESLAVAVASAVSTPGIAKLSFRGEWERWLERPEWQTDRSIERLGSGLLLPPELVRYGSSYPLVVWVRDSSTNFSTALVPLMEDREVGILFVEPGNDYTMEEIGSWVDEELVFVIYDDCTSGDGWRAAGELLSVKSCGSDRSPPLEMQEAVERILEALAEERRLAGISND